MLGPLPLLHRLLVGGLALLAFVGLGAWLAWSLPIPLLPGTGAMLGAFLGAGAVLLLLHSRGDSHPRPRRLP